MFRKAISAILFLLLLTCVRGADSGAPVVTIDGQAVSASPVTRGDQAFIALSTSFANGSIFYTLDGTEPSGASTRYTAPFTITSTKTLRAIAYSLDFSQSALGGPIEILIAPTFLLNVNVPGGGSVTLDPTSSGNRYLSNAVIQLTAQAAANWRFVRWAGDASGSANPLSVLVTQDMNITAVFGGKVDLLDAANGRIQMSPFSETEEVPYGATIRVTPIPDAGFYFASWGGSAADSSNPIVFPMTTPAQTFSALFLPLPTGKAALSVYAEGTGGTARVDRRMTFSDATHTFADLPATNLYQAGETVVVIAEPNPGYTFTGWSMDAAGTENPLAVKLEGSKVIRANFAEGATLRITTSGGTVSKSPNLDFYSIGQTVTLEAQPLVGYEFDSFELGSVFITNNPTTVIVTNDLEVIVRFNGTARQPVWERLFAGAYEDVIAADDAGNSYIGEGSKVVALNSAGEVRWSVNMPIDEDLFRDTAAKDMAINPVGEVDVIDGRGGRDTLHMFLRYQTNGTLINSKNLGSSSVPGRMAVGADGRVFYEAENLGLGFYQPVIRELLLNNTYGPGNIINLDTGGSTRSELLTRPAIGPDQKRYFTGSGLSNAVYCSDAAGNILWRREIDGPKSPPIVMGAHAIYAIGGKGRLWAFGYDGSLLWTTVTADPLQAPSLGGVEMFNLRDGMLYLGAQNSSRFYAIQADGNVKWVSTPGNGNYKTAAVGSDGTIYVTDSDSIYALDQNGNRMWQYRGVATAPIISSNLVLSAGAKLVALPANSGGLPNSPWPMRDATPQQTAAVLETIQADPPKITSAFFTELGFEIQILTAPGSSFTLQSSTNLVSWETLDSAGTSDGNAAYTDARPLIPSGRFYRLIIERN